MAVNKFAACVTDINAWLSACRLRLNAAKTQLLWLGSSQLVDRVDCHDVLVLGTRIAILDTACNLGVVIDPEMDMGWVHPWVGLGRIFQHMSWVGLG